MKMEIPNAKRGGAVVDNDGSGRRKVIEIRLSLDFRYEWHVDETKSWNRKQLGVEEALFFFALACSELEKKNKYDAEGSFGCCWFGKKLTGTVKLKGKPGGSIEPVCEI